MLLPRAFAPQSPASKCALAVVRIATLYTSLLRARPLPVEVCLPVFAHRPSLPIYVCAPARWCLYPCLSPLSILRVDPLLSMNALTLTRRHPPGSSSSDFTTPNGATNLLLPSHVYSGSATLLPGEVHAPASQEVTATGAMFVPSTTAS